MTLLAFTECYWALCALIIVISDMRIFSLASIFVVGMLTGSLVGGYQSDLLGRRRSMMLDSVTMLLGLIAISLAPGWKVLLLGR